MKKFKPLLFTAICVASMITACSNVEQYTNNPKLNRSIHTALAQESNLLLTHALPAGWTKTCVISKGYNHPENKELLSMYLSQMLGFSYTEEDLFLSDDSGDGYLLVVQSNNTVVRIALSGTWWNLQRGRVLFNTCYSAEDDPYISTKSKDGKLSLIGKNPQQYDLI